MLWFGNKDDEGISDAELAEEINILELQIEKREEKLNPAQEEIAEDQRGDTDYTSINTRSHVAAYKALEVVNRGTNLLTDGASEFKIDIGEAIFKTDKSRYMRKEKLNNLLNFRPNEYQSAEDFKRNVYIDLVLEGNAFIYFDGAWLYNLPSLHVEIITDKKTFINSYKYDEETFSSDEIIHIRENAASSIYRGASRLESAVSSISILTKMNKYQENFFKNNTILGVVLKTPNMLSEKIKNKKILQWMRDYNPSSGGRKPMILDGDYEIEDLAKYNFKELDFAESIKTQETKILEALGVPPVLLVSGNNANITPNLKLFYIMSVLPLVNKFVSAFELFFGFDLKPVTQDILALRPELNDLSTYLTSLVNAGVMTRNEAREILRLEKSDDPIADSLILPANIAGSNVDPSVGGKPKNDEE